MAEEALVGPLDGESSSDTCSYKTADSGAGSAAGELAEEDWPTLGGKKTGGSRGHRRRHHGRRRKASCWQGDSNSAKTSHLDGKAASAPKEPSSNKAPAPKDDGGSKFRVQQERIGLIIGKGGQTLQNIKDQTGAAIEINQSTKHKGYSTVRIKPGPGASQARELLDKKLGDARELRSAGKEYLELRVQQTRVGGIIGNGGETIQEIMQASGADLTFNQQTSKQGFSVLRISGSHEAVAKAKALVNEILGVASGTTKPQGTGHAPSSAKSEEMKINQDVVGCVIGTGGETLRSIQRDTGTTLRMNQTTQDLGYSLLRITGDSDSAVQAAKKAIQATIGGVREARQPSDDDLVCRVEQQHVSSFIGKGSRGVQRIINQTGASIDVDHSTKDKGYSLVRIRPGNNASRAWALVTARAEVARCANEEEMRIEQRHVGSLMGWGGSKLREIEEQSGAELKLDRSTHWLGFATLRISGVPDDVQEARELVRECLATAEVRKKKPRRSDRASASDTQSLEEGTDGSERPAVEQQEGSKPAKDGRGHTSDADCSHHRKEGASPGQTDEEDRVPTMSELRNRLHNAWDEEEEECASKGGDGSNRQEEDGEQEVGSAAEPHEPSADRRKWQEHGKAESSHRRHCDSESSAEEEWGGGLRPLTGPPDVESPEEEERVVWTAAVAGPEAARQDLPSERTSSESACEEVLVTGVRGIVQTDAVEQASQAPAVQCGVADVTAHTAPTPAGGGAEAGDAGVAALAGPEAFHHADAAVAPGSSEVEVQPWAWTDPWAAAAAAAAAPWGEWWWDAEWAEEAWQASGDSWQNWKPRTRARGHRGGAGARRRRARSGSRDAAREGSRSPGGRYARSSSPAAAAASVSRGRRGLSAPGGSEGHGHEEMEIPQRLVGWLIGRNGSIIDQIRTQTDAVVELDQSMSNRGFSVLHITGDKSAVSSAREFVQKRLKGEGQNNKVSPPARRGRSSSCAASRAARAVLAALLGRWHSRGADGALRHHEVAAGSCRTLLAGAVHAERPLRLEGGDVLLGDRGRLLLDAISDRHAAWMEEGDCQARSFWTRGWPNGPDWEDTPAPRPRAGPQSRPQRESSPDVSPDFDMDADEDFPPLADSKRTGSAHDRGQWPVAPELAKRFQ